MVQGGHEAATSGSLPSHQPNAMMVASRSRSGPLPVTPAALWVERASVRHQRREAGWYRGSNLVPCVVAGHNLRRNGRFFFPFPFREGGLGG